MSTPFLNHWQRQLAAAGHQTDLFKESISES
jgi:hypothetical protein